MKRSILVAAGTAVGVTAVVSYHATGPSVGPGLVGPAAASTGSSAGSSTHHAHRARHHHTSTAKSASSGSTTPSGSTTSSGSTTPGSSTAAGGTRSALGQLVNFPYGELQVKVTEQGRRITDVAVSRLSVPEPQSGSIDQIAVPQLRQEVLAAQGLNINGVSGASYTSQAYAQSVQSALDKLKQ